MIDYIYMERDWPRFRWDEVAIATSLADIRLRQGRLLGRMESLGFSRQQDAELETLTVDVLKSSEIEGERLPADQVRSSVARRLGLDTGGVVAVDRHVDGVVEMMLDATQNFREPLTEARLFAWHSALFPTGRSGMHPISVGTWRTDASGPMQVVSGPVGRERVHYQAPDAAQLPHEMSKFLAWANDAALTTDGVLKAALAHLWFVTVHPFDDGNGRMARAIGDWALARSEGSSQRFYSMSAQICEERRDYYALLERTQQGSLDVTPWMQWFLACLGRAFARTETTLAEVLRKSRFWERHAAVRLNERQRHVITRLLDGFDGKLTTTKWAALTRSSHDTALRDIQMLIAAGILTRDASGGRSTSYSLAEGPTR